MKRIEKFLKDIMEVLRDELDSSDFIFESGYYEQSFPEDTREIALEDGLTANVCFVAEGVRTIDRGDYYQPPYEKAKICVSITRFVVWNEEGEKVNEYRAVCPFNKSNSFNIEV